MRVFNKLTFVISVIFSLCSMSFAHDHHARRHNGMHHRDELAVRAPNDMRLWKRYDNARFTYYAVGLGACGQVNQPSDFIVALNSQQFGAGGFCFQMITITVGGKTTQAQIMDECPGCPFAGLDFSEGLFKYFADESAGVLYGTWVLGSGAPPSPSPPPPEPTTTWQPPTTTWQPPTTWSPPTTSTPQPTTTSTTSTTTTATSSSTTVSDDLAVETSVPAPSASQIPASSVLNDLNQVLLSIGILLVSSKNQ
ncbi:RlpA-like double-psi beta-barrel-protein domain-containing protein-containing protein [Scleroderma yunnanense]